MRIKTVQHPQITRSQFLRSRIGFPPNHISVKPTTTLTQELPYVGSTGFTPTANFYVHLSHEVMRVDSAAWRLNINGLVGKSLAFSLDEIQTMQAVEMAYTLAGIMSTPHNLLMGHALWRGVSLMHLLDRAGLQSEAQYAQFRSQNGYVTYLPIHMLDKAILAYAMNGEPLSADQGHPVRLIVPGVYDYKLPKWLQSVELVDTPSAGHFESRGWSAAGLVQTTSAIFTPRLREVLGEKVLFSGMAFAGARVISRIELSIDDGEWMPVSFKHAESASWTRWQIEWQPPAPGDYLVKVRATDSQGFTQPDTMKLPVFPNGSSAIHAVVFRVSM